MKGQVDVEAQSLLQSPRAGETTRQKSLYTLKFPAETPPRATTWEKGETETSSPRRQNPNRKPLQGLNGHRKFHLQKNCCVKTDVLLFSLRNIYYTNLWLGQDESSLIDCPQRQVNRILKKKALTRSSTICHIKCLVSNKTYQIYQKKGQISETKREKKKVNRNRLTSGSQHWRSQT